MYNIPPNIYHAEDQSKISKIVRLTVVNLKYLKYPK